MRTSFLIPVYNTDMAVLRLCINSVLKAAGDEHEVVVVDDASNRSETLEFLSRCETSGIDNLKILSNSENSGVSYSLNKAASTATGMLYAPVDHDDMVVASGFEQMLRYETYYGSHWAYSDELQMSNKGVPNRFMHKPEFSLQLLRSVMYINHLQLIPSTLFELVGGYREGFEGSQDHDLALRLSEQTRPIHVATVAYLWRRGTVSLSVKHGRISDISIEASQRALEEHFDRLGITAQVTPFYLQPSQSKQAQPTGTFISRILPAKTPNVSIIIPCKLGTTLAIGTTMITVLNHCLHSIVQSITSERVLNLESPEVEVILVLNHDDDIAEAEQLLQTYDLMGCAVRDESGFNFSRKCNLGAAKASGDILVILNDDTDLQTVDWLDHVISLLQEDDVACLGGMLLNLDRTVQSCGDNVGRNSAVHYVPAPIASSVGDAMHRYIADHETTSVTGAFFCCRKNVFEALEGFSLAFPNSFQDVDFCLRARSAGMRCLVSPHIRLIHFESVSRNPQVDAWTLMAIRKFHESLIAPTDSFGLCLYEKVNVPLLSFTGLRFYLGRLTALCRRIVVILIAYLQFGPRHPPTVLKAKEWRVR